MGIHTRIFTSLYILGKSVCGNRNYQDIADIRNSALSYQFCRFYAVHYRHLYIHKYRTVIIIIGRCDYFYTFTAIFGTVADNSVLVKHCFNDLIIKIVILCYEYTHTFKFTLCIFRLNSRNVVLVCPIP